MARATTVEIEFGGKTRRLVFDFNAQAEIEEAACTFDMALASKKALRIVLWAGLLAETLEVRNGRLKQTKATLSELQVGEMLGTELEANPDYGDELAEKIKAAREAAAPKAANPPVAVQPSPMTNSGQSAATTSDSPNPTSGA